MTNSEIKDFIFNETQRAMRAAANVSLREPANKLAARAARFDEARKATRELQHEFYHRRSPKVIRSGIRARMRPAAVLIMHLRRSFPFRRNLPPPMAIRLNWSVASERLD